MSTASPSSTSSSYENGVIASVQGEAPQVVPPTTDEAMEPVRLHRKRLPHAPSFEFGIASSPTNGNQQHHLEQDRHSLSVDQGSFMLNNPASHSVDAYALPLSGNEADHHSCNAVDSGAASPLGGCTRSFMDGLLPIDSCLSGSGTHLCLNQPNPHHNGSNTTSPTTSPTSHIFAPQYMSGTPPNHSMHQMPHHRSISLQQQRPVTPVTNSSITTYLNSTGQTFRMLPPTAAGGHSQPLGSDLFSSFFSAPNATPSLLSPQLHGVDRPESCNGSFILSPHQSTTNPSIYDSISGAAGSTTTPGNTTPSQQFFYIRTQGGEMAMVPAGGGQLPGSRSTPSTHPMDPHGSSTSPSQLQHSFPSNLLSGLSNTYHTSELPPSSSLENSRRGHQQQQRQQDLLHTSSTLESSNNNRVFMFPHSPAQSTTEPTPMLSPLVPDMNPHSSSGGNGNGGGGGLTQHQYLMVGSDGACSKSQSILSGQSVQTNFSTNPVQSQSAPNKRKDNLYVSGLPSECRDKHLHRLFAPFGDIISASVRMDIRTGRSRGFGFVKYAEEPDAALALNAMAGKQILTVSEGDGGYVNFITADELKACDGSTNSSSGNQINNAAEGEGGHSNIHSRPSLNKMKLGGIGGAPTVLTASPISVVFAQNDADYHPGKLINKVFARNFPSTVSKERVREFFEQFEGFVSLVYQVSSNDAADAAKSAMLSASSSPTTTAPIVFISAYVTYDTVENAIKAAQGAHSSVPFPEEQRAAAIYMENIRQEDQKRATGGRGWAPPQTEVDPIPILAKVAEAHDARKERLGKKATQINDGQQHQHHQFRGGGGDNVATHAARRNTTAFNPVAHTSAAPHHFIHQQQPPHHLHNLHHGNHQTQHIFTHQHHQQHQSFVPAYHNNTLTNNYTGAIMGGHQQHAAFQATHHQLSHHQQLLRPPQQHQQQQQRIPPHYQHHNQQQPHQLQFTHQQFPFQSGTVNDGSMLYPQGQPHQHMSMMGMHTTHQYHFDPFTMNQQQQQQQRSYQH
jgi:hypothetical protein